MMIGTTAKYNWLAYSSAMSKGNTISLPLPFLTNEFTICSLFNV